MDNSKNSYKSHVSLCQALMRPYKVRINERNGDEVYYWDMTAGKIKHQKIRLLDAEEQYYEPLIEDYLAKNVESEFFGVVDGLRDWFKNKKPIENVITASSLDIIRNFYKITFTRSKEMFEMVKNNSVFLQFVEGFTPGAMIAFADAIDNQFAGKQINIIINRTSAGFVCPHNIVYYVYGQAAGTYLLAITVNRNIAICLNMMKSSSHVDVIEAADIGCVEAINLATSLTERNHQSPYIVGCEQDLIRLIELYKKNEDKICDKRHPLMFTI